MKMIIQILSIKINSKTLLLRMCPLLYDDFVKCCKQSRQNEDYEQDG